MKRILIIEDEEEICSFIKRYLESSGDFEVSDCFTRKEFKKNGFLNESDLFTFVNEKKPNIILLDIKLPGLEGFEICKILKTSQKYSSVPIIILSGQDDNFDKVSGLNLGADDYVVKPFSLDELNARIKAVLRRLLPEESAKEIHIGEIMTIDPQKYEVIVKDKKVELTPAEFKILELLASRKGHVFSRETILDSLWGSPTGSGEQTVDVHIRHLREKLGKAAKFIKSVRGIGYKLEEDN